MNSPPRGVSCFSVVGNIDLVRRLSMRCAGLVPTPWVGVFLISSRAKLGSELLFLHFFSIDFAAFTPDSTFPFAFECVGADGQCSKSHSTAKS